MSTGAHDLLERALALPPEERAALLEALAGSLGDRGEPLSPEWRDEIARRIAAVESGESRLIPGDEVDARIRALLSDG